MRAIAPLFFLASLLASGLLSACGGDDDETRPSLDPSDAGSPPGADDGGTSDAAPDVRPPFDGAAPEIACAVTPCMKRIVAGPTHYCAFGSDGIVRCWGNPSALGDFAARSSGAPGASPVVIDSVGEIVDVGASALRTCVALADGGVDCFGKDTPSPTRVAVATDARKLAIGDDRNCAIGATGELVCWGDSDATGKGDTTMSLEGEKATAAVISERAAFAVGATGALFSWGADPVMLGRDTPLSADWTPDRVAGLGATLQVAASDRHVCALTTGGRLFCWGHGDNGALGLGSIRTVSTPTEVLFAGPAWPAQVAVALTHSCVRMTDSSVACWARVNTSAELGHAERTGVYVPTRVSLPKPVAAVATGTGSTCVLATDGSVQCWGDNSYGQLGLGQRDGQRHYVPTAVVFP